MIAAVAPRYYPHIDGLRAVAVLGVIFYHLRPDWLPGGFVGVDVFFVLSGYVVSASLRAAPARGFGAFVAGFYARRLRRIAPALVACLLVTGLASALWIPPAWLSQASDRTGLLAFVGLSNFLLARTEGDYFSPLIEFNPYAHTWSLGVEEQFYLLFPLLFYGWVRGGWARRMAFAATALGAAGSLLCAWYWTTQGAAAQAFYLLPSRFWQLASGVLLFQLLAQRDERFAASPRDSTWRRALGWVAFGALLCGLLWVRPGRTPWPDSLPPVLATLAMIALLHVPQGRGGIGSLLSSAPFVAVGKLSYSLYLWHWPVFVLLRWTIGLESWHPQALGLLIALALSLASYFLVERPARYGAWGRGLRPAAFVLLSIALVAGAGFGFRALYKHRAALSQSVVVRDAHDWYPEGTASDPAFPGCEARREMRDRGTERRWHWRRHGCPAPATGRSVFVIGDSHALGYTPLLQKHVLESGDEVRLYHRSGCPWPQFVQPPAAEAADCRAAAQAWLEEIQQASQAGDVLFLPSLRLPRLAEQWQAFGDAAGPAPLADRLAAEDEARRRLASLAARGVNIVLEAPKPVLPAPPYRCSDAFNAGNPICAGGTSIARQRIEAMRAPVLESMQRLVHALPGATVWDPLPLLCGPQSCDAKHQGRPLYFDGDHLSGYGNRALLPAFQAHLAALPAPPGAAGAR